MKKKYSVIIPIYKAERTLKRCVDSLICQNRADAEIILVNDGSPDACSAICNDYLMKHDTIIYIEQPNGGVSSARNAGLDVASGEYILFVDSDDYVSNHYFATLDQIDGSYDFAMFSHCLVKGKTTNRIISKAFSSREIDRSIEKFCELWYKKSLSSPVTKRYRSEIIQNNRMRFLEQLSLGEDKLFNLLYIMHCQSCLVSAELLYYVSLENSNSLSRKPRADLNEQLKIIASQTQTIIRDANISTLHRYQFYTAENLIQLRGIYSEAKRMRISGISKKKRRVAIGRMCNEQNQRKLPLPKSLFSVLLKIPVRLKLICFIDWVGWYLTR